MNRGCGGAGRGGWALQPRNHLLQHALGQGIGNEFLGPQPQQLMQSHRTQLIDNQNRSDCFGFGTAQDVGNQR